MIWVPLIYPVSFHHVIDVDLELPLTPPMIPLPTPPPRTPAPPPPTQYCLGYAYACSLPLKAPPYLRTDKISDPPFRGLFAGFSCLGDPPRSKTLLNVPPIFYFITPFLNFSGVQRERERKTTPFLKEISGWKVKYPPFLQFSGRTLSHEKYPFTGDFGNTACPGGRARTPKIHFMHF